MERAFRYLHAEGAISPEREAALTFEGKPNSSFEAMVRRMLARSFEKQRREQTATIGVACLTAKHDDLLMWGHYADGHRGICLEFATPGEPFSRASKVQYRSDVPRINPMDILEDKDDVDLFGALLLTKHNSWSYEQEWRLVHEKAGQRYSFDHRLLTGVYLGASMPRDHKELVAGILLGSPTTLYEMVRGDNSFPVSARSVQYTPPPYGTAT
jgi:hypothetical protein